MKSNQVLQGTFCLIWLQSITSKTNDRGVGRVSLFDELGGKTVEVEQITVCRTKICGQSARPEGWYLDSASVLSVNWLRQGSSIQPSYKYVILIFVYVDRMNKQDNNLFICGRHIFFNHRTGPRDLFSPASSHYAKLSSSSPGCSLMRKGITISLTPHSSFSVCTVLCIPMNCISPNNVTISQVTTNQLTHTEPHFEALRVWPFACMVIQPGWAAH